MNKKKKLVNKKHRRTKDRLKALKVASMVKKKKVVKAPVEKPKAKTVDKAPAKKTAAKKASAKKTPSKKQTPAAKAPSVVSLADLDEKTIAETLSKLKDKIDPGKIDWGKAGYDFGEGFGGSSKRPR